MGKSRVTITGGKELLAALENLATVGKGVKLIEAVNAGLLVIQNEAQAQTPYLTGTLRRSIHLGEGKTGATNAYNTTGTDVAYAARIEYGFDATDSLGRSYHQSAQPYLRPAFDGKKDEATGTVADMIRELIAGAT